MDIKKYLGNKVDNLGTGVSSVVGAGILGQFPQFVSQYTQRLGGHIDELSGLIKTVPEVTTRYKNLKSGLESITNNENGAFGQMAAFFGNVDPEIAMKTFENYTAGITFDETGLVYVTIGAVGGYLAKEFGKDIFNSVKRIKNK